MIFINQIRMKIGVMFGSPETTTGGNALKFYASVRMDIRRTGTIKKGDEVVGSETKVKVVKNKVVPPRSKEGHFDILTARASRAKARSSTSASSTRSSTKSGAWYAYKGDKDRPGQDNARVPARQPGAPARSKNKGAGRGRLPRLCRPAPRRSAAPAEA